MSCYLLSCKGLVLLMIMIVLIYCNLFHQFEDDEGDRVLLATDDDLVSAVSHARGVGLKVLRLHLDFTDSGHRTISQSGTTMAQKKGWTSLHTGVLASAAALTSIGVLVYLKRTNL